MIAHGAKETSHAAARQKRSLQEAPLVAPLILAGLSAREREVCAARAQGLLSKEIAHLLGIAEPTVRVYLHRSYRKLRAVGGLRSDRTGILATPHDFMRKRPFVSKRRVTV